MIYNQWYVILQSKEVKNKPVLVKRLSMKLVLYRKKDKSLVCMMDRCCHRGGALHLGKVKNDHIECPFHGFSYDETGRVKTIPANGIKAEVEKRYRVRAFHVKEINGLIFMFYGDYEKEAPKIPFFYELCKTYSYSTFNEIWPVHYSRAIENQLDVVHLPFVHKTTIGRGNQTLVNGPKVIWEDNLMTFYVMNEVDEGKKIALKPNEIKDYKNLFHLKFQMPNYWQNMISDDVRIFAAFAPIDESHTMIYLRFYQKFTKIPIIKQFINQTSKIFNRRILHQDRRVVLSQEPIKSELKMDEKLIQGDMPIIEYRKRREELKKLQRE